MDNRTDPALVTPDAAIIEIIDVAGFPIARWLAPADGWIRSWRPGTAIDMAMIGPELGAPVPMAWRVRVTAVKLISN